MRHLLLTTIAAVVLFVCTVIFAVLFTAKDIPLDMLISGVLIVIVLVTLVLFLIVGPSVFSKFFAVSRDNKSIHALARKGDFIGVKKLLALGADVNERDKTLGVTPLLWALMPRNLAIAPLFEKNNHEGKKQVAELLINEEANVNVSVQSGRTPLHYAVGSNNGYKNIVKLLISKGAEIRFKAGIIGTSPLHEACYFGDREIVELLIANGADVNEKTTEFRESPFDLAEDYVELQMILRKYGAIPSEDRIPRPTPSTLER